MIHLKTVIPLYFILASLCFAGKYHPMVDYIFPLPDSKLLPVKTTIILKLEEKYNSQIKDLSKLIRIQGQNGSYSGNTFFSTDQRTIIFKPGKDLRVDETIKVTIQLSQFGTEDFSFSFYTVKNTPNDLGRMAKPVQPSLPHASSPAFSPVHLINGVAVPGDFPKIQTSTYGETAPGRIYFAATHVPEGYGNYIVICENDGTPYFYRRYPDIPRTGNFTVQPTGVLSFHCYETFHILLDKNFTEIDTVYAGHGYDADDHELQILENGHILQVVRQQVIVDMSKIVTGCQKNALVEAHHFQEMDEKQNVIFEWRDWDHLDIRDTYVSLKDNFIDFVHLNSIAIDYDGNYIVSLREYKAIVKIDHLTGDILWQLGGRQNEFKLVNEDIIFSFQHDVRPVPGKPDHYALFDNGRERYPQFSRAVEYKLDLQDMTAEKVWEYRHDPDWYSGWMGSVQRFDNGNTLIEWPGSVRATEVTVDGETAWEMFVTGIQSYRCRRYEWQGKMQHPCLILENLGTTVRLIFNKFGDTEVKYYRIYTGKDHRALAYFDSTRQTYYDIDVRLLGDGAKFVWCEKKISFTVTNPRTVLSGSSSAPRPSTWPQKYTSAWQ